MSINNQGMNWIRQEKRLAIYLRDGLACVYCDYTVEDGATLTLDHLKPKSKGGYHQSTNLVTCCFICNSSRGTRSLKHFCVSTDLYRYVRNCARRSIKKHLARAKELIALRGSCTNVLNGGLK